MFVTGARRTMHSPVIAQIFLPAPPRALTGAGSGSLRPPMSSRRARSALWVLKMEGGRAEGRERGRRGRGRERAREARSGERWGEAEHNSRVFPPSLSRNRKGPPPTPAPSPSPGKCVPNTHGPKCSTDAECKQYPNCLRCARSGFCTMTPLAQSR